MYLRRALKENEAVHKRREELAVLEELVREHLIERGYVNRGERERALPVSGAEHRLWLCEGQPGGGEEKEQVKQGYAGLAAQARLWRCLFCRLILKKF